MNKQLIVGLLVAAAVFYVIAVERGRTGPALGQQPYPEHITGHDLEEEIRLLVEQEKERPTNARNVQDRHRRLTQALGKLIQLSEPANSDVDHFFSPRDETEIQELFAAQQWEQAAELIHRAIVKMGEVADSTEWNAGGPRMCPPQDDVSIPKMPKLLAEYNIHALVSGNSFSNLLKLANPVIDPVSRRLYFTGGKSTSMGVIDMNTDELIETFDMGRTGDFLFRDPKDTNHLYLFEIPTERYFRIDIAEKTCSPLLSLPAHVRHPPKDGPPLFYKGITYHLAGGYPFRAGFLQEENASYSVLVGRNAAGSEVCRILYGPDALYDAFDPETGKFFATITGDASISIFDFNEGGGKIKSIDVGTSVEQVVLIPDAGGLFIRNRLGGSTILHYEPATQLLMEVPNENAVHEGGIGMWPTEMIYDEGKLYVLSHYAGRIDVVDATTYRAAQRINLDITFKPRTDSLSTMVMDRKRKILYAAFPELGEIARIDAKALECTETRTISRFDTTHSGAAVIALCVDEEKDRVFAYLSCERRLDVYSGGSLSLLDRIEIDVGRHERVMTIDQAKGVLFLGNQVLDLSSLEKIGTFSKGQRVVGVDTGRNRTYLATCAILDEFQRIEVLYEFEGENLRREFSLSPIIDTPSSFAFDFEERKFFVGYFESATVAVYDLQDEMSSADEATPPVQKQGE